MAEKVRKSDEEWRRDLTPQEYHVCREKGTEPAFTGKYYDFKGEGVYRCACCGNEVFASDSKYDSGTGWPSFSTPIGDDAVETKPDRSKMMERTEVLCADCESHLGHVFRDGPEPTGLRYCINSTALDFEPGEEPESEEEPEPGEEREPER